MEGKGSISLEGGRKRVLSEQIKQKNKERSRKWKKNSTTNRKKQSKIAPTNQQWAQSTIRWTKSWFWIISGRKQQITPV
jgi:hypothetical protein